MSSLAGWEARYHTLTSPYPTMKRAQGMLAKNYSKDLAPRGVRVNSLVSGAVETPNLTLPDGTVELSTWHAKMQSSPEAFEGLFETIPMRRAAKPEETANAVIFLSTHLASYITGASLFVDGGMSTIY